MSFTIFSNAANNTDPLMGVEKVHRNHLLEVNEVITKKTEQTVHLPFLKNEYARNIFIFQGHSMFTIKLSEI